METDFEKTLKAFIDGVQLKAKDGLTLEEAFTILIEFVELAVNAAKELSNPGPEKRELVLHWVGILFDTLAPVIGSGTPAWYWPFIPFVRPLIRQIVLTVAAALLERYYKKVA